VVQLLAYHMMRMADMGVTCGSCAVEGGVYSFVICMRIVPIGPSAYGGIQHRSRSHRCSTHVLDRPTADEECFRVG
jgi:hypothetical protein